MNSTVICCLEILFILSFCSAAKLCSDKLLDNNKVPDSAFLASSHKDQYAAKWAKESPNNDMAWCPNNQISDSKKEFISIDLGDLYMLKMIMTKGLSRHGFTTASSYGIEYKREEDSPWIEYREKGVEKRIKGNRDHLTEKYDSIDSSIIARWIKIYPLSENIVRICLVLQLYGCRYTNNVLEYKMVDGSHQNNRNDYNYDGDISKNYLSNGLGRLVTYFEAKATDTTLVQENDHFIGWSRDNGDSVIIIFRFNLVRNFTSLSIETSNNFTNDIRTFSKIDVYFSMDDKRYEQDQVISITTTDDTESPAMRSIKTDLRHRIGRFVKVVLSFRSKWIVIRTVYFQSEASANYLPIKNHSSKDMIPITRKPNIPFPDNDFFSIPLAYTLVIVISILIIMLLIGIPCVTIFIRRQKKRNKKCKEALQRHFQEEQARFLTMSQQHFKDSVGNPGLFTVGKFNPNVSNMTNRMIQESSIYTSLAGSDTESNCASEKQQYMPPNFNMMNPCPIINPVTNNRSLSNDYSATSFMTLGSNGASYMPYYSHNAQLARSQVNLRPQFDIMNPVSLYPELYPNEMYPTEMTQSKPLPMFGPIQIPIQGPAGNSKLMSTEGPTDKLMVETINQLKMVSLYNGVELDNLMYVKTVGRGCYGSIHIAEWTTKMDEVPSSGKKYVCNEYNSLRESLTSSIETENGANQFQEKQLSSVKVLSKDAPAKIKREFYLEIKYLMNLNHKNFVSILNLEETSLGGCVVVSEYTHLQDVFSYLQTFHLSDSKNILDQQSDTESKIISQPQLLFIASQVASAMKHLETLHMVHCDLACRNLLVMNKQLHIKITDLAMSQQKFNSDYVAFDGSVSSHLRKSTSCLIQGPEVAPPLCLLPIRWMSCQALLKGIFSSKSDVYSFGVMVWELLTLCQQHPYHELTNEQVIINSNLQSHADCRAKVLTLPKRFSKELNDFINNCTLADENNRPSFTEIDMFLQRKTIGSQSFSSVR